MRAGDHTGEVGAMVLDQQLHLGDDLGVNEQAEGGAQKAQVGGRIVQHARKEAAAPIEQPRAGLAQPAALFCSQSSAGIIVAKMPMNRMATSWMG